ncbi:TIGR02556 family CRISPR-associated protein [Athalassotoga saccharophila]|uniref:TIGR02556 family CRISPR-associated protein n=1 Tax=Athalassotoga saccharophila TaxID=1441386 RepID=UPI00137AF70D|nr:TIGR02556 family CRISPR-associated protein [Athalassotoga saccharophila]BBJ28656.1 CRISPR-Associated Protein [Athalassotoga saccharophila]
MLKSVRDIGRIYGGNDTDRLLSAFPSSVKVKDNPENIQAIVVKVEFDSNYNFSLKDIVPSYLKSDPYPLLYKQLYGNDKNLFSPTIFLKSYEYVNDEKADQILKPFGKYSNFIKGMNSQFLKNFADFLDNNIDEIAQKVSQKMITFSNKNAILTFEFESNGKVSYPADVKEILEAFVKSNQSQTSSDSVCCVCGRNAPISKKKLSDIEIFKFATVEKRGFLPDMNPKNVNKILPICEDCYKDMQLGSKIILKNLDFPFYSQDKVWVIPKSLNGNLDAIKSTIDNIKRINSVTLDKDSTKRRSVFEMRILKNSRVFSDFTSIDFVFYRPNNAQRQIILNIQDMPPTWIKEISDAMDRVDSIYKKIAGEWYDFTLRTIYDLTAKGSKKPNLKDFYIVVRGILEKRKPQRNLIISNAIKKIRSTIYTDGEFKEDFRIYVYDAMTILDLFKFLNKDERSVKMASNLSGEEYELDKRVDEFFNNSFDTSEKKGLFYLGVLVGRLVACQQNKMDRSKAPFYSQLKGLRMKREDFKGLYAKVINKMIEYSSNDNCYLNSKNVDILKRLCAYYLNLTTNWELDIDEANFIFVSGMTLSFAEPLKISKGEEDNGKTEEI